MKTIWKQCIAITSLCWAGVHAVSGYAMSGQSAVTEPAGPAQTVVLLSSVDTSKIPLPAVLFFMRHYYRTYELGLEKIFRAAFAARGYRLEIHAMADQHDLWEALHSPKNVAVFWLSHATFSGLTGPGLGTGGEIADARGFDVTDAFQEVHPNLRFLGVVGCKSEPVILQQLDAHGVRALNPELQVMAFDRKVDAKKGLKQVLSQALRALSAQSIRQGYESACPLRKGYELKVRRHLPEAHMGETPLYPAARIETGAGEILGVFPKGSASEVQELTVHLDLPANAQSLDPFTLKLVEDAGGNVAATRALVQLGSLEFSEPWAGAKWVPFATPAGELMGVTSHVYRYQGSTQLPVTAPTEYAPFACEAMPPVQ